MWPMKNSSDFVECDSDAGATAFGNFRPQSPQQGFDVTPWYGRGNRILENMG
jgi:hypothetical protein